RLEEAYLLDSPEARGVVNGVLSLTSDLASPLLAGEIVLGPMEVSLPESPETEVPEVNIRNPGVLPKQPWQEEEGEAGIAFGPDAVRLDVGVKAPSRVYVRGRGLETEIRGAATVGGTMAAPEIEGEFRTVRGVYTLLNRELEIIEGVVTFRGVIPPSPFVRMV